ncbi:ketoacyl-ACP synthase III [Lacrimispora sp. NSJ-141]|uniref:Beta-ketoacyl-[acyl-carrier-protein] synthase III n=1 Tax=Lientehia hominis TaxID=2897778 RepID=A0AAP2WAL3_9FIRM|nr:beta-ketoacyl-ACP synthase III [Lientehia hominis]MCD2493542.1 ketoacyl-ACP synthase III [Lientehia hominis]
MAARIIGTGSYVPDRIITNDDLAEMVETSDAWIVERTGIRSRRITETGTTDMAVRAAKKAMENAGLPPEELELIVVATSTGDCLFPNTACEVQADLGAEKAVCFDLSAACSGFLFSLNTAKVYLESGAYKTALVVGADTLSKTVDWSDRSTCILFGDGAGAAVLSSTEDEQASWNRGIGDFTMGSDGSRGGCLTCRSTELCSPFMEEKKTSGFMTMNGQEVFRFAVKTVPRSIEEVLKKAELSPNDVKYFILHQANERIIASVAKRMKQDTAKFPMNLAQYGNTSGASIPVLLDEINRKGLLKPGDKLVISGFGAGLTWGATLVVW